MYSEKIREGSKREEVKDVKDCDAPLLVRLDDRDFRLRLCI